MALAIEEVLGFYRELWQLANDDLQAAGRGYAVIIRGFRQDLADEIEAIAQAAGQPSWALFALNARSELFNNARIGRTGGLGLPAECTVVFDTRRALLAQNWDWARFLEDRVLDLQIDLGNGTCMRTLTEPGILAKIGLNSHGLGVGLNILATRKPLRGVPVHLLLRALLECRNLAEAESLVREHAPGKASHVLLADAGGACVSAEFTGDGVEFLAPERGSLLHTNHYLARESLNDAEVFTSTRPRLETAKAFREEGVDSGQPDWVEKLLAEQSLGENSVCKPWSTAGIRGFGEVGTVFTVLMNLPARRLEIRPGSDPDEAFYSVSLGSTKPSQPAM